MGKEEQMGRGAAVLMEILLKQEDVITLAGQPGIYLCLFHAFAFAYQLSLFFFFKRKPIFIIT